MFRKFPLSKHANYWFATALRLGFLNVQPNPRKSRCFVVLRHATSQNQCGSVAVPINLVQEVQRLVPLFSQLRDEEERHLRRKLGAYMHLHPGITSSA